MLCVKHCVYYAIERKLKELHKVLDANFKDIKAGRIRPFTLKLLTEFSDEVSKKGNNVC